MITDARSASAWGARLCRRLKGNLPAREDEYRRMTFERPSKYLGPFDPEINPTVLDGGQGGLGDSREFGQLALAQFLKFAKDTDRLAHRDFNSLLGSTEFLHISFSCNHEG